MENLNPEVLKNFEESMKKMQDKINSKTYKGQAGGGLVDAIVNGKGDVISININIPHTDLQSAEDITTLSDLIVASIKKAQDSAATGIVDNMGSIFGDDKNPLDSINDIMSITKNLANDKNFNFKDSLKQASEMLKNGKKNDE